MKFGQWDVPAAWMRLHCPCEDCSLPEIGERRVLLTHPDDWSVETVDEHQDAIAVTWASGHQSSYPLDFVDLMEAKANRRRWEPSLWSGGHAVHEVAHDDLLAEPDRRREALQAYRDEGVLVIRGVPTAPPSTEGLLDTLRIPIWEGPFGEGRFVDTRVQAIAYNVAETAEALPPHSDLAGYQWPPSGQILHLTENETEGGDSLVVDSWNVLAQLRDDHPDMFDVLAEVVVSHRLFSADRETFARAPLVRLDGVGNVNGFRFSNQTIQPLPLDEPRLDDWHMAYAELSRRLTDPASAATFKLGVGDAYVTHAHRVLHGRTAFSAGGARCIRDAYFEFDNVLAIVDQLTGEVV